MENGDRDHDLGKNAESEITIANLPFYNATNIDNGVMIANPAQQQAALDQVSRMIADLDHIERMICVVNAFVFADSEPTTVISALAQTMVSLAFTLNDDAVKQRCADALTDAGAAFAESIQRKARTLN